MGPFFVFSKPDVAKDIAFCIMQDAAPDSQPETPDEKPPNTRLFLLQELQ
jgi:hypothetical protein